LYNISQATVQAGQRAFGEMRPSSRSGDLFGFGPRNPAIAIFVDLAGDSPKEIPRLFVDPFNELTSLGDSEGVAPDLAFIGFVGLRRDCRLLLRKTRGHD
jgi:hypothetical protein